MNKYIEVFTDGASKNNNSKKKVRVGGIGIFFNVGDPLNVAERLDGKVTNQIAELKACQRAIHIIIQNYNNITPKIKVYTDSMYLINCITTWSHTWSKNGWTKKDKKPVENLELIKDIYEQTNKYKIIFIHVNSHMNEPTNKNSHEYFKWFGNHNADKLANIGCLKNII